VCAIWSARNNDQLRSRANVLDKNAVSLATGAAVFPSTATDGDLRRRACSAKGFPFPRNYAASFTVTVGRLFSVERHCCKTGIYREDVALFTISTERLTSTWSAMQKVFAYQKWISTKWYIEARPLHGVAHTASWRSGKTERCIVLGISHISWFNKAN